MPRFIDCSSACLGVLTLGTLFLGAYPAQAQSSLLLGSNSTQNSIPQPGHATLSDTGTVVSGSYWFYGGDLATATSYDYLETDNTSTADISGGTVSALYAADSSVINIYGGTVSSLFSYNTGTANVFGGTVGTMQTVENGIIDLQGTNFAISVPPAGSDQFTLSDSSGYGSYYTVTGTLQNSLSPFTAYYDASSAGTLEFNDVPVSLDPSAFNPVPEASTVTSFGLLLALGGLMLKRVQSAVKKKKIKATV